MARLGQAARGLGPQRPERRRRRPRGPAWRRRYSELKGTRAAGGVTGGHTRGFRMGTQPEGAMETEKAEAEVKVSAPPPTLEVTERRPPPRARTHTHTPCA